MIEAQVLSQLLLMQSMLNNLPDETSMFHFVTRGLADIPGVEEVRADSALIDAVPEGFTRFPLVFGSSHRGEIALKISDMEAFEPYLDHLNNFFFTLAVILEERFQRKVIEKHKSELEQRVQERTAQLLQQVAERVQAEKSLRISEQRYRVLVENAPDAIVVYDADRGVLVDANPVAERLFGISSPTPDCPEYTVSPRQGETCALAIDFGFLREFTEKALEGGGAVLERTISNADGAEVVCEVRLVRLPSPDRSLIRASFTDITERKRMMELVLQSEKMLSVGGLAAGMAHEINNPLSGIIQGAQVVLNRLTQDTPVNVDSAAAAGCPIENIRDFMHKRDIITMIESIKNSALRAARVVSTMLEFSRKSDTAKQPEDIVDLLDKSIEIASSDYDLKKKYDFRRIAIKREYDPSLPLVPCAPSQIQQVVLNILGNAAQAMARQDEPGITLRTLQEGEYARIEIEDNGPGMDESVRKKIFEPFFTTKKKGEGTGLGLSVSYFIIATNHGGTLEIDSSPGKGARFIIRLPLSPGTQHEAAQAISEGP